MISAAVPLKALHSSLPVEAQYGYDGTESGAELILNGIQQELTALAMPWFAGVEAKAHSSVLVQHGLQWLDRRWSDIPPNVADELHLRYEQCKHDRTKVDYPLLNELKAELRSVGYEHSLSNVGRSKIKPLADDILAYAQFRKQVESGLQSGASTQT